jgi:hypothetical protein
MEPVIPHLILFLSHVEAVQLLRTKRFVCKEFMWKLLLQRDFPWCAKCQEIEQTEPKEDYKSMLKARAPEESLLLVCAYEYTVMSSGIFEYCLHSALKSTRCGKKSELMELVVCYSYHQRNKPKAAKYAKWLKRLIKDEPHLRRDWRDHSFVMHKVVLTLPVSKKTMLWFEGWVKSALES